ncbi:PREDICTED: sialin-like [Vollenhovia emeryi]|uniref:sialin-like n=1 Tax=Vollenhovia emeryi TaxID=411798 RepID=UPI0005F404C9|nr:PREDICTED: sialin-like [Vollenhovia emeryi]
MKLFLILPQNLIAHPYFWGYMTSIIPGGRLAELKSPKILMEISIIVNVGALALSPIAAHIHTWLLVAVRLLQGIADSVALPAMHMIISKWAPPNERHVIASIVYAGAGFIIATSVMLTELIYVWLGTPDDSPAASHYLFCFQATLCFIWSILWYKWITDSPTEQTKYISEEEREYIVTSLKEHMGNFFKRVPWWQIFCSSPFMAIVIAHICSYFSYIMVHNTLHSLLPCISKHNTISATELLIFSIPCIGTWVFAIILSRVLATWQEKDVITVTRSRKISILFASLVPTLGLLLLTIRTGNRSDYTGKFMLMTIMMICMGGIFSGCYANHIDIAPKLAGSLLAITNFVALGVVVILFQLLAFVARSTRNKVKRFPKSQFRRRTREPNYFQVTNTHLLRHLFFTLLITLIKSV